MLDSVRVDFSFVRVEKRSDSSFVMATVVLLSRICGTARSQWKPAVVVRPEMKMVRNSSK